MPYTAIVNVPGYLPTDDDDTTFDTTSQAWTYLADSLDDESGWTLDDTSDPQGPASRSTTALALEERARRDFFVGTVYGPTPGYDGDHDLGLAYTVDVSE